MHCVNKNNVNPNHPTYQTVLVCSPRLTGRAFLNESDPVFLNKDNDDDDDDDDLIYRKRK